MRELRPDTDKRQSGWKTPQTEQLYMPAMPPLGLISALERWLQRRRIRRSLRALLACDNHLLRDLGYSRAQLCRNLRRPLDGDWRAS